MKTAIYLRQSLDREQTQLAVGRQREACLDLCKRRGLTDLVEYVDNSVSASTGRRPEYRQMLADIGAGAIGTVVCYHLDRLHRRPAELETFIDVADRNRVALATVTGEVDLSTAQGRLVARIMGAVARNEVEHKSARQKSANEQRARNGKAWNVRVFGYDGDEVVKREADAIRKACEDLLNGASLYGIAQEWNRRGLTTVKGYQWNGTSVRQMLMRPRNAGLAVYDVHSHKRIQDAIIEGAEVSWPAIVSRETYDAVASLLADPGRHTGKKRARVHLLSGLAVCGLCGRKMGTVTRATRSGGKRHVYQCKNLGCMRVVRDVTKTDRVVVDIITARLARPDAAQIFAKKSVDIKALGAEANRIRASIRAAEVEYEEGLVDARLLKGRKERLQPKLAAVEKQLLGATTSHKLDGLIGHADAAKRFAALPLDRQRAVIDTVAEITIEVSTQPGRFDPASITIGWR